MRTKDDGWRMSHGVLVWMILLGSMFGCASRGTSPAGPATRPTFAVLAEPGAAVRYEYAVLLPAGQTPPEGWPLILSLHGSAPADFNVYQAARDALGGAAAGAAFPFIVITPFCPASQRGWDPDSLNLLLAEVVGKYPVDRSRIYGIGQSRGGFGTWALATKYPGWFAAIAPICGGGDATQVQRLKDVPHWIFHGGQDNVVLPSKSANMAKYLKAVGCDVTLTIYPDEGHEVWNRVYKEGKVFDWFLQHRRPTPATVPAVTSAQR